ncbi:MAG: hypothetical protein ABI874_13290 [Chloroflexota bacterium]
MQAQTFYKVVTQDKSDLFGRIFAFLDTHQVDYCVIGSHAVNAYVAPVVSLDLDIAIDVDPSQEADSLLESLFDVTHSPHRLDISAANSKLQIHIHTHSRYMPFIARAKSHAVLGMQLRVASLQDVLQERIWAAQDPMRRGSKRRQVLMDIARIIEAYPRLRAKVPDDILRLIAMR